MSVSLCVCASWSDIKSFVNQVMEVWAHVNKPKNGSRRTSRGRVVYKCGGEGEKKRLKLENLIYLIISQNN